MYRTEISAINTRRRRRWRRRGILKAFDGLHGQLRQRRLRPVRGRAEQHRDGLRTSGSISTRFG